MRHYFFSLLLLCAFALFSCSKDGNPVTPATNNPGGVVKVGEQTDAGVKVELFVFNKIETGYNKFYVKLTETSTNKVLHDARVHLTPIMDMGTMQHSAPTEQPEEKAAAGLFPCAIVFTMPETATQKWSIRIDAHDKASEKNYSVVFPVAVHSDEHEHTHTLVGSDGASYIVTMMCLCDATVGMNTIELLVHRKQDMMTFPAVSDVTMTMTPDMPSMGHGSPNNVNPTPKGNGHYEGKVNFTMTGEWRIEIELYQGSALLGTVAFTTTL